MATTLADLAAALQTLFTTDAADLAHATGFVRRARKLTGPAFAQVTVFGWLHNPTASLADLAELAAHLGVAVCPSALDQRFGPPAAAFLQALLAQAMNVAGVHDPAGAGPAADDPAADTLLGRFTGVYIDDSTTIGLPLALAEFFPGCGGRGGRTAALKVPLRLELRSGALAVSDLQPGRACDLAGPLPHAPLPAGSLRLADLGYYSLEALQEYDQQGVYILSRLPARTALFEEHGRRWKLHEFLAAQTSNRVDVWVRVGTRWRVRLRLLAWRVPPAVAALRRRRLEKRAQKSGRPVSAAQAALASWNVVVTNAPEEQLSLREACVLARLRWQVELVFKLWKSAGRLDESAGSKPYRVLCELLAKLLGLVMQHWALLTAGPPLRQSQQRAAQRVRAAAERLAEALPDVAALVAVLGALQKRLQRVVGKRRRRGQPAAFQLAENPFELEFTYMPAA
jgi:Transposase DDE domain